MSLDRAATNITNVDANWADHSSPQHPHFDEELRIREIVSQIKSELLANLIDGARTAFAGREGPLYEWGSITTRRCWEVALRCHQYDRIYLLSRQDARSTDWNFLRKGQDDILRISDLLAAGRVANRIFNYAIHKWVQTNRRRVDFVHRFVPRHAIASVGPNHLAVRQVDFFELSPEERFSDPPTALFDLHDLAHQACAQLCPELYGSKYFEHLIKLPRELTCLITSENQDNERAIPFSDGLVFSHLLLPLYDQFHVGMTAEMCVDKIASAAVPYFLGRGELLHEHTRLIVKADKAISPVQLATLVQNKFYELPASEIEQKLMTRGGLNDRDPMRRMTSIEKVEFLAGIGHRWLYFERRNTLRHRAHLEIYRRVAVALSKGNRGGPDEALLRLIVDAIGYTSYRSGGPPPNLWQAAYQLSTQTQLPKQQEGLRGN